MVYFYYGCFCLPTSHQDDKYLASLVTVTIPVPRAVAVARAYRSENKNELLIIIQVLAILQGIFLGFALLQRRQEYKRPVFGLFIGSVVSVILFSLGDDDYNVVVSDAKWFFFQEPLMITFFFLFIRYSNTGKENFSKLDALFFLPYFIYLLSETLSNSNYFAGNPILETSSELIELSFTGMLLYSIYDIVTFRKNKWLLAFIIPFAVINVVDTASSLFSNSDESIFSLDSYGVFLIAVFLFYFVTYKLIISPKDVLPTLDHKYRSSKLSKPQVEFIERELKQLMVQQELFKNQKLSVQDVAEQLGLARQQLSEVLNVHMGMRFQDLLNQYRVEAFIQCLHQERYNNYTLLGIATEVGFSSKSSFNSTFKKLKGVTPSQYRRTTFG